MVVDSGWSLFLLICIFSFILTFSAYSSSFSSSFMIESSSIYYVSYLYRVLYRIGVFSYYYSRSYCFVCKTIYLSYSGLRPNFYFASDNFYTEFYKFRLNRYSFFYRRLYIYFWTFSYYNLSFSCYKSAFISNYFPSSLKFENIISLTYRP